MNNGVACVFDSAYCVNVLYHSCDWDDYRDYTTQIDCQIPGRKPDLMLINKKKRTCHLIGFAVLVDNWVKIKENQKVGKYLDFARELKKPGDSDNNCSWCVWNSP